MQKGFRFWTIGKLVRTATNYLSAKIIENPRLNAERIIGKTMGMDRVQLYLNHDRQLNSIELKNICTLLKRRGRQEPLQYILGETEFMSLKFSVPPGVLIPRPETETLVELVVEKCCQKYDDQPVAVLDIGTGCGCIAVSLAHYLTASRITAIDICENALQVAQQNAELTGVASRINFANANIFCSTTLFESFQGGFDLVISNPPYISAIEYLELPGEIKNYEPETALNDGGDGLSFYRRIAEIVPELLNSDGILAVEIGSGQASSVRDIFSNAFREIDVHKDLNGHDRVVMADCLLLTINGPGKHEETKYQAQL